MYLCEDVKDHWYHDLDDISCQVITFLDKNKTQNNIGNESIYIFLFYFWEGKKRKWSTEWVKAADKTTVKCSLWTLIFFKKQLKTQLFKLVFG